jgi:uncharacterized membrane protein
VEKEERERFIEIDLIRGFALTMMIAFHLLWDLDYYGMSPLNQNIYDYGHAFPPVFFCLVGVCLVISSQHKTRKQLIYRGTGILIIGILLTAFSKIIIPDKPITFGVLHCIGLSIIFSSFIVKKRKNIMYFALIIITLGVLINNWNIQNPNIIQLAIGLHQQDFWRYTVDYFPLLPWFGVVLFGMAIGDVLYRDGKRQFPFPDLKKYLPVRVVSALGKKSLLVYLVHQPIIVGAIHLPVLLNYAGNLIGL